MYRCRYLLCKGTQNLPAVKDDGKSFYDTWTKAVTDGASSGIDRISNAVSDSVGSLPEFPKETPDKMLRKWVRNKVRVFLTRLALMGTCAAGVLFLVSNYPKTNLDIVWHSSGSREVFVERESPPFKGRVFKEIVQKYSYATGSEISKGKKRGFLCVVGPDGCGKTAAIQNSLNGVLSVNLIVRHGKEPKLGPVLANLFGEDIPSPTLFLQRLNRWARVTPFHNAPITLHITVKPLQVTLTNGDADGIGQTVTTLARNLTYDNPTCPVIIETADQRIASAVNASANGLCKMLHVPPMHKKEQEQAFGKRFGFPLSSEYRLSRPFNHLLWFADGYDDDKK